ncbi:MAG: autotransporter domain-containing protein [Hyphomicrobiales bacterium]|nr:autotransporter domain-containing protein [Hyphomicrobiales bacterium]
MPTIPIASRRRFTPAFSRVPALLATTSVAALLMAPPAQAGQNITTPQMVVTNPAGNVTTSIVITGTTVTGAVTNAGTITPGTNVAVAGGTAALAVINSSVGGGISNAGAVSAISANGVAEAVTIRGATVTGGVANAGKITASGTLAVTGINSQDSTVAGGISNGGTITVTSMNGHADGFFVSGSITGGIVNSGVITATNSTAQAFGIKIGASTSSSVEHGIFSGGIANSGTINATGKTGTGIAILGTSTVTGGISNTGVINVSGAQTANGIRILNGAISGGLSNTGTINVKATLSANVANPSLQANGLNINTNGTFTGPIANTGMIQAQGTAPLTFTGSTGTFVPTVQVNGETITAAGGTNSPNGGQIASAITNAATIGAMLSVTSTLSVSGNAFAATNSNVAGLSVTANGGSATAIGATAAGGSVSGGTTNAGTISVNVSHMATLTDTGGATSQATSSASATGISVSAAGANTSVSKAMVGGGSISGNIMNAGSITVSATGDTNVTAPTNGGSSSASTSATGLSVSAKGGIIATQAVAQGGNFTGNITNAGTITSSVTASLNGTGNNSATAAGVSVSANGGSGQATGGTLAGAVLNSGMIVVTASGSGNAVGVFTPVTTNFVVASGIGASANGGSDDAAGGGALANATITNTGLINASAKAVGQILSFATGISITAGGGAATANANIAHPSASRSAGGVFRGDIVNNGTIFASATSAATAANAQGVIAFAGGGNATVAKASAAGGTLIGNVVNNGSIVVSVSGTSTGSIPASGLGIDIAFGSPIEKNGGVATPGTIIGSVLNAGSIQVNASGAGEKGIGISVGTSTKGMVRTGVFTGAITNSGTINAVGTNGAVGTGIAIVVPVPGGITNTGTITGSTSAIDLSQEVGGASVVNQNAGTIAGSIIGSGNTKGDVLNVTGGAIVLQPTQSISGFGTYTQTGGTLVFNVTQSTTPGTYPTLSAGTINLRGGTFELSPVASSLNALATQHTTVFKNAIVADPPLSGSFAAVTTPITLFQASLSPDATTANSLDATLTLSAAGLATSAQDLTQDGRLGLDAPRVLTQAIQDRLIANGGALGEWLPGGGPVPGVISRGPVSQPSYSFGNANVWARGYDQFGSATASAASASVGYDINRAAPLIAGIDWRLDNNIVAGVAATYVLTSAKFKDGSSTNVNSYQGGAYAGWNGGPWYALGSVVASFNDFGTSRLLTPFGLPGDAASSPSGQSYQAHAEAGNHWLLPAAGTSVSITPYAALDYVFANVDGFSETGGFGALSVSSSDNNSFQTTLGVRLNSRIATASGTLIPELRVGWSHEFLDASQKITASLVGIPGSGFTSTGILFGRDAALVGAGFSFELSPDAKVFVDYDGRLGSRLQEHSISGGVKVRF